MPQALDECRGLAPPARRKESAASIFFDAVARRIRSSDQKSTRRHKAERSDRQRIAVS
jgi:hypothetical protein